MNPQTLLRLCSFTYFDLPELYIRRLARGETVPLSEAARALRRMEALGALTCGAYLKDAQALFTGLEASKLRILAYENDNASTGFVAYAFASRGETIVAVRGSETKGGVRAPQTSIGATTSARRSPALCNTPPPPPSPIAIRTAPCCSPATPKAATSPSTPKARRKTRSPAPTVERCVQGFACHALSKTQKQRLRAGAVNYVVAGDIVGALLCHLETRFYVRQNPGTNAHSPDAFCLRCGGFSHPRKADVALPRRGSPLAPAAGAGNAGVYQRHPPPARLSRPGITQIAWTAPRGRGIMFCVTN